MGMVKVAGNFGNNPTGFSGDSGASRSSARKSLPSISSDMVASGTGCLPIARF